MSPPQEPEIAGLPGRGETIVSGLPTAPAAGRPLPEWPLTVAMAFVALAGAFALIAAGWGGQGAQRLRPGVILGVPDMPPGSTAEGSYLNPATFRTALGEIDRRTGRKARVELLSVSAGMVWATLNVEGRREVLSIRPGELTESDGDGAPGTGIAIGDIDAEAPGRIIAGLRERYGVRPEEVDYVAVIGTTGTWSAVLRAPEGAAQPFYSADARGEDLVRAG